MIDGWILHNGGKNHDDDIDDDINDDDNDGDDMRMIFSGAQGKYKPHCPLWTSHTQSQVQKKDDDDEDDNPRE